MTTWKLQKLLYYSQAWSLVWDEKPLFRAKIRAWTNGPVIPEIYRYHKGKFKVSKWERGNARKLDKDQKETVDAVLKHYGNKTGQELSDLTHREEPWRNARSNTETSQGKSPEITLASMGEYYSSIAENS